MMAGTNVAFHVFKKTTKPGRTHGKIRKTNGKEKMLSIYLLVLNFQLASKIFFWVRARAKTSLKK